MDELDRKIVEVLQSDGRLSIPQLAEQVGTSRATAYARFERLTESGVIAGFAAVIEPRLMGFDVSALVKVRSGQQDWPVLADSLRNTVGVCWVALGAGEYDFAVLVRAHDLAELRDVVLDGILRLDGVTNIETNVLLDEFGSLTGALPSAS